MASQQQMMELTTQLTDTMNQAKITESTVYALEVERRRQELTLNELSSGDYTRLFKPVGRAYFLYSREELSADISAALRKTENEIVDCRARLESLFKKRDDQATQIQELVGSSR
jgi:chaperonin cofactor prefoldin